ncbi:MAG TPA: FAD-dependent oxidoreductase [Gallionellaceae bacterium]
MKISRRRFIAGAVVASGLAAWWKYSSLFSGRSIPGEITGASSVAGHRLRERNFPAPARTLKHEIVIVGGGIAGLSAAYRLSKAGNHDFLLLEIEPEAGGNSSSGKNGVSAYPWGAHYVPLLTQESVVARQLFEEFGIIKGQDKNGLPVYDDFFLCADPHERLYMHGKWQDGMVPNSGISAETEAQYKRFFALMDSYKNLKGGDGKKAFAIPVDASSQDAKWLALDDLTMQEWMDSQGFVAEELRWYVNYCCRDDFGVTFQETSAWAGIHYFASRTGRAANAEMGAVLTWPEGNGWLAAKLGERVKGNLRSKAIVYKVSDHGKSVTVEYFDQGSNESVRIEAKAAILAVPRFVASRIVRSDRFALDANGFSYAPWAVANVTLDAMPSGRGAPLSWDNVAYRSPLLGYVVATHQVAQMHPTQTVLTYYWPLSHLAPAEARKEALARSYEEWQQSFVSELLALHPELKDHIRRVDVRLWGHAMIRPRKGFIWGSERRQALLQHPPLFMAHSDMSGISIFEEACTRGFRAAESALQWL